MKTLTSLQIQEAAEKLHLEPAIIKAVCEVEAANGGFINEDMPRILFERHKFHQFTGGIYSAKYPKISNV